QDCQNAWPRNLADAARPRRRGYRVKRREFISLLGGAAAWPLAARAQQSAKPLVGFLWTPASPSVVAALAFRQGLKDTGFIEGQNVAIEYRFAEGQYDRLPDLLAELIRQKPMVIVAPGTRQPDMGDVTIQDIIFDAV